LSQKNDLSSLMRSTETQGNPIDQLRLFIGDQEKLEAAKQVDRMRFIGYVLELGFQNAKIITSDPYKIAVGGVPRGSFLIMTPNSTKGVGLHFTLLRVTGVSPTPLSNQVQQTYFELHKKSMPELDLWTQSELQWGALTCDVLGMFYADPQNTTKLAFSGDVNNVVSAHRYKVFSPDDRLLKLIVNGIVKPDQQSNIGKLRTMECQLAQASGAAQPEIPVTISMTDFKGCRTAMFGKTRLGKSNVVKLIASGILDASANDKNVGQLIFDINGEYANDNPQDGNKSIRSAYQDRCEVYALTARPTTPSKPLRFNFYEKPDACMEIIASLLQQDNQNSNYIKSFASAKLVAIESIPRLETESAKIRAVRKIQMYWAILNKAGFEADEARLKNVGLTSRSAKTFNPGFPADQRAAVYAAVEDREPPAAPSTLAALRAELSVFAEYIQKQGMPALLSSSGNPLFEADDEALLKFLNPSTGSGPAILRAYQKFHDPKAGDFIAEILVSLEQGKTVILDLGNANDATRRYFSDILSTAVFRRQEDKFVSNTLGNKFIQLYFEEAHNLFPPNNADFTGVYTRFAKEGAKFHIGMVYSTQSPSTINRELLAQTENFFVGHMSSEDEVKALAKVQTAFMGIEEDILRAKTPGYMRMLTMSHRFVIPVQAKKFDP
jgi:Helicase HerA, central domain